MMQRRLTCSWSGRFANHFDSLPHDGASCRRHSPRRQADTRQMRPCTLSPRLVPALLVKDMAETLAFHGKLGFAVTGCHPDQLRAAWADVTRDGVVLQFHSEPSCQTPPAPVCSGTIHFHPGSVGAMADKLRGKIEFTWGPEVMDYGLRELAVQDPSGYHLAFTEPVQQPLAADGAARRR